MTVEPYHESMKTYEVEIRIRRAQLRWTQKRLADTAGVSRPTISYIEAGKADPTLKSLKKIGLVFRNEGVPFDPAVERFLGVEAAS